MANGVNRVFLIGNIGSIPELKEIGETSLLTFSLATSERFKGRDGGTKERTEWHDVKVWGKRAGALGKFLTKGMMVCVEGSIKTESWEQDGVKRFRGTIVASNLEVLKGSKVAQSSQGDDDDNVSF